MEKPFKYTVICDKTGDIVQEINYAPPLHHLQTWKETDKPDVREFKH